jgi:hypothetical protein
MSIDPEIVMRRRELSDEVCFVIEPVLPINSRGVERIDDRRVINGRVSCFISVSQSCDPKRDRCGRYKIG